MRVRKLLLAVAFLLVSPVLAIAQESMNNDAIIKMVKAGLSEELIISTISSKAGVYDTSVDGIIALKSAGVSDKIVSAIVSKPTSPVPVSAQAVVTSASQSQPTVTQPSPAPSPNPPAGIQSQLFHSTDGKVRVYITDHPFFESNGIARASGDRHGGSAAAVSHTQGGDDPRTVEVEADIQKVCPSNVIGSNNPDRADYVLIFRRRGGERSGFFAFGGLTGLAISAAAKVDGASLFQNDGDMVYATKKTTVEKAIRDICLHIPAPAR